MPTAITFDPHPRSVLHPASSPPLLQTLDQKVEGFGILGIEQTIVIRFTEEFAQIRAEDFLRDVVRERLHAREVYWDEVLISATTAKETLICYGR